MGIWTPIHFKVNKAFWSNHGLDAALPFRIKNLVDLQALLAEHGAVSYLYGRTLLDVMTKGRLLDDHDDDLIASFGDKTPFNDELISALECGGFSIIRKMSGMFSVMRFERYIDVHVQDGPVAAIEEKIVHGSKLFIRENSVSLLVEKYGEDYKVARRRGSSLSSTVRRGLVRLKQEWSSDPKRAISLVKRYLPKVCTQAPRAVVAKMKIQPRVVALSEAEFLKLKIDADDAVNWEWRKPHLAALIKRGETFGEAIQRLRAENIFETARSETTELNTSIGFTEPMNLSRRFWQEGSNLFLYPAIFGFRHLVMPYDAANLYVLAGLSPKLYSYEYFETLPMMSDEEIADFLIRSPLEVTDGALSSGRHRATAMLGRLVRGEPYITIYARIR